MKFSLSFLKNSGVGMVVLGAVFVGCSGHTPIERPALKLEKDQFQYEKKEVPFKDSGKWWEVFQEGRLNELMEKAFVKNAQIKISLAKIKQLQAAYGITTAALFPSLNSQLSATQSNSTSETAAGLVSTDSTSYGLSLNATYSLDLFGKNSALRSAAQLEVLAKIEDHRGILMDLSARLAKSWFMIKELAAQIKFLEQAITDNQANLEFVSVRYNLGLSTMSEMLQAQQELIASQAKLPDLEGRLKSTIHTLKLLTGQYPHAGEQIPLIQLKKQLPEVAVGLPSQLIKRRPDLRAAFLRIKIADYKVASAIAAQYPQISLTASAGVQSESLSNLLDPEYSFWNLASNILMPLLDAGGRAAEVRRQRAVLEETLILYDQVLYQAFQEVEENLVKITLKKRQMDLLDQQVVISRQTFAQNMENYRDGLETWSQVLNSQARYYDAEKSSITAQRELIDLRVSLFVALGGSWTEEFIQQELVDKAPITSDKN